jgi:hypothetical protein
VIGRAYTLPVMGRAGMVVATVLLGASAASAEVMVRVSGDRVDVRATAAPLADVLDRLARQTGMAIVYEGPPPRQPITVAFAGRSPAEAVLALLEGQGLNYALVADPTGRRVATLLLSGTAGTGTFTGRPSVPTPARARRPFLPIPGASPDAADPRFAPPEEPMEDAPFLPDEAGEDVPGADSSAEPEAATPAPPVGPTSRPAGTPPAGVTAPLAPVPAPGSQGQTYPVSPFTPQPSSVLPFPPAPPGTPGATPAQEAPATNDTTSP